MAFQTTTSRALSEMQKHCEGQARFWLGPMGADAKGTIHATDGAQYMWRKLRPLRELPQLQDLDESNTQLDLFGNECEGMCGV